MLLVNKPKKKTSHDIVNSIRNALNQKKVGHFGTLDPMATGLMIIGVGRATKLFPFYAKMTKVYNGQMELGYSTDTYDAEGNPTSEKSKAFPSEQRVREIIKTFEGDVNQIPPPYSAKKFKGKPLYKHARENNPIQLPPQKVKIFYLKLRNYHPPFIEFVTKCSSGTYIRSLAHEIGKKAGCGGHLSALERTEIASFRIKDSFSLEEISSLAQQNRTQDFLLPLEKLLPQFPKIVLSETGALRARNGASIKPDDIANIFFDTSRSKTDNALKMKPVFRLFDPQGKLIALARRREEQGRLFPFTVIDTRSHHTGRKGDHHAK
ncbi:MAG: tRNA pseudouridine(55) synthase TruB [Candidatus Aminicenantes bacterium]|nr:tRNA pseudouridine(55) synthase TruB [Candidatus Aminicenantes bacterium]